MTTTGVFGHSQTSSSSAERWVWIVLLAASGMCLSMVFACVTPFAAIATLAGLRLGRRDGSAVIGLVWVANQTIGYGFLGYPRTWDSAAWGLAIGLSAGLAAVASRGLSSQRPAPLVVSLPFVAAFTVFEFVLYLAGFVLPGSEGAFSASVVGHVFLVNAVAFCALVMLHHLAMLLRPLHRAEVTVSGNLRPAS